MAVCIGIDPGIGGAVAFLDTVTGAVKFCDMPTITVQSAKRDHREIDAAEIVNMLMREIGRNGQVHAILEKVSAAPIGMKQRGGTVCPACGRVPSPGATSTFNFGMGFGIWKGVLAGLQIPFTLVHPATWKSKIMRDMGKGKGASIIRAKELYPQASASLSRVKDHGRADALLLAHYGKMFEGGEPRIETPEFRLDGGELPF